MRNTWCLPDGRSHYEVVSPSIRHPAVGFLPSEEWVHYAYVAAHSQREAKILALKTDEFAGWRTEANGNPFAGLVARLAQCAHGVCWVCHKPDELSGCAVCDAEVDRGDPW